MATLTTVNGVNAAKTASIPPSMLAVQENYGRVRYLYDSYTMLDADDFSTSGLIKMMKIPANARVIDAVFACTTSGTAGKFEIGWAAGATATEVADADGLFTEQDPGQAAITGTRMVSTVVGWNKTFAEEVQVQLDCTEATTGGSADTVFELGIWIVVD